MIALSTGVVANPFAIVDWDGSDLLNAAWEGGHSMDSTIKLSRSRGNTAIPPTTGSDLAARVLNEIAADSSL